MDEKTDGSETMTHTLSEKKRTLIFINIIISCVASAMLVTALTTALPAVADDLQISLATGQWLTSGYSLVMGMMMPLTAFLITRFPTKKLYLTGLGISLAGLLLCAGAPNFAVVMFARALQAIGNGVTASMGQVIILTIYPPERRGTAMGWYGLSAGAAPAIAPMLAGFIVDTLGWRAIFYCAFAIFAAAFLWALYTFDNVLKTERKKFDTASFLLSIAAFGGITLGIGNSVSDGLTSLSVWPVLAVGVAASIGFVKRQLRLEKPFLELRVFQNKSFTQSVLVSMMLYFVMMGLAVLLPLYLQTVCGYSATVSGMVRLPGSLAMAAVSLFAGKIYDKVGIRKLFLAGTALMLASGIGLLFIATESPLWLIAVINIMNNASIGFLLMPLVTWGMHGLSDSLTAHGSALLNSLRTVAGSIGTAIFVSVMASAVQNFAVADGAKAMQRGFFAACIQMTACTLLLLLYGALKVKTIKSKEND